ncbi:MAG: metal-sensitive transcriptional regulator [Candidatus Omnitrophica bacterium]|nr:metal-sensitive transcriptional regulator [Candidatus Omnitrophota bacterium]
MIDKEMIKKLLPRVKKIEGQVRGLGRMIEKREYCVDILQQIFAIKGALKSIGLIILENHINTCVKQAIVSKDQKKVKEKIEELLEIYEKFSE